MNPFLLLWGREAAVFHVRAGGCGGCSDAVDEWIRFSRSSRLRLIECSPPRHAGLVIVTGCRRGFLDEAALSVIEQAPKGCPVLLVGDCVSGRGPFEAEIETSGRSGIEARADLKIEGCPVNEDSIAEGVKRCLGLS